MRPIFFAPVALALVLFQPAYAEEPADELYTCGYLCGEDGQPLLTMTDEPPDTELVTRIFLGAFSETCSWAIGGGRQMYDPEVHDFSFRYTWSEPDQPDQQLRLYQFFCGAGAYNSRHVYLSWTADTGVRPVLFPVPTYDVEYVEDGNIDSPLKSLTLTGMTARYELVNSELDASTGTLKEWSCWRGLCDASGAGTWVLDGGTFRLVTYDIDPTYDSEVNQFRVVDFSDARPIDTSKPLPFTPPPDLG